MTFKTRGVGRYPVLLTAICIIALNSASFGQQNSQRPIKLAVQTATPQAAVGQRAQVEILLQNAQNQTVKATKDLSVSVEARFASGKTETNIVVIRRGEDSSKFDIPLSERGITEIRASHRELLDGGVILNVHHPLTERMTGPSSNWRAIETNTLILAGDQGAVRPTETVQPGLIHERAMSLGSGVTHFGASMGSVARVAKGAPAPVASAATAASVPHLFMWYTPKRRFLADGRDSATIQAELSDPALDEIRLILRDTSGSMRPPSPLIIHRGKLSASASLASDQPGLVTIEYLSANHPIETEEQRKMEISFKPPITKLEITPSSPHINMAEPTLLLVRFKDEHDVYQVSDEPRSVSFVITDGKGTFTTEELTIQANQPQGSTTFIPTWRGRVVVSARSPTLEDSKASVDVTWPVLLLCMTLIGGSTGGAIAYWKNKRSGIWRIPVGLVTGFVLYWAYVFGASTKIRILSFIPQGFIVNPLVAILIAIMGGWLGVSVFKLIFKKP